MFVLYLVAFLCVFFTFSIKFEQKIREQEPADDASRLQATTGIDCTVVGQGLDMSCGSEIEY